MEATRQELEAQMCRQRRVEMAEVEHQKSEASELEAPNGYKLYYALIINRNIVKTATCSKHD